MDAEIAAALMLCGIYSMTAIATQLGMVCGAFSLAPVGWMCVGAYAAALATTKWQLGAVEALIAAVIAAAALGPVVMFPARRISGLYFALISLAFVLVIQSVVSHWDYTGGAQGLFGVPLTTDLEQVGIALAISAAIGFILSTGRAGRSLRAAGQDPTVARTLGINVGLVQLAIGGVSAAIAVVSGFLYARYVGYVDPTQYGFALVVQIIVMVIVGGRGSWFGAIFGACFITLLPLLLRPLASWRDVANGALLIVVAIALPNGLIGLVQSAWQRVRLWDSAAPARDGGGHPTPLIGKQ